MCREDTGPGHCQRQKFWKAGWGEAIGKEMCLLGTLLGACDEECAQVVHPEVMQTTKLWLTRPRAMACLSLPAPIYFNNPESSLVFKEPYCPPESLPNKRENFPRVVSPSWMIGWIFCQEVVYMRRSIDEF